MRMYACACICNFVRVRGRMRVAGAPGCCSRFDLCSGAACRATQSCEPDETENSANRIRDVDITQARESACECYELQHANGISLVARKGRLAKQLLQDRAGRNGCIEARKAFEGRSSQSLARSVGSSTSARSVRSACGEVAFAEPTKLRLQFDVSRGPFVPAALSHFGSNSSQERVKKMRKVRKMKCLCRCQVSTFDNAGISNFGRVYASQVGKEPARLKERANPRNAARGFACGVCVPPGASACVVVRRRAA
eukprot:531151-Pleurochrysis_carterae.AAC.3